MNPEQTERLAAIKKQLHSSPRYDCGREDALTLLSLIDEQQTEITRLIDKNLGWLAAWNEHEEQITKQQTELDEGISAEAQKRIYEALTKVCGDDVIDGGGCESGCPVDCTVTEVKQGLGYLREQLAERDARIAELEEALKTCRCCFPQTYLANVRQKQRESSHD